MSPNKNRPFHTEGGLRNPQIPLEPSGVAIYINFIATEQPKHGGGWDVIPIIRYLMLNSEKFVELKE